VQHSHERVVYRRPGMRLPQHHEADMDDFHYQGGVLHCENVPAGRLADEFGTPLYV